MSLVHEADKEERKKKMTKDGKTEVDLLLFF